MSAIPSFDTYTAVDPATNEASARDAPSGFGGVGGSFAAVVALRSMTAAVDDERRVPRSLHVRLLGALRPEPPVTATATVERSGRSITSTSATLVQGGKLVAAATSTFGPVNGTSLVPRQDLSMPDVPPPAACPPLDMDPMGGSGLSAHVERRPVDGLLPLSGSDDATLMAWLRIGEDRPTDAHSAAFLADGVVPPIFATLTAPVAMPSLEIGIHFAAGAHQHDPSDVGWLLGVFAHRQTDDGFVVDDGELWTPSGQLALTVRQLRLAL